VAPSQTGKIVFSFSLRHDIATSNAIASVKSCIMDRPTVTIAINVMDYARDSDVIVWTGCCVSALLNKSGFAKQP